jgi:hypothetical protein
VFDILENLCRGLCDFGDRAVEVEVRLLNHLDIIVQIGAEVEKEFCI